MISEKLKHHICKKIVKIFLSLLCVCALLFQAGPGLQWRQSSLSWALFLYVFIPRRCSSSSLSSYHSVSHEFMSFSFCLLRLYAEGIHFSTQWHNQLFFYSSSFCFHPPCPKPVHWIDVQSNWFSVTFSKSTFQTIPWRWMSTFLNVYVSASYNTSYVILQIHKLSHLFHSVTVYRDLHFLSSSFTYSHNFCLFDVILIFIVWCFAQCVYYPLESMQHDTIAWSSANRTAFTNNLLTFNPSSDSNVKYTEIRCEPLSLSGISLVKFHIFTDLCVLYVYVAELRVLLRCRLD